ncbi:4-amino-4-deoxy-L-arabinose transferase-like glycosyltransferase [Kibdelosporangium banguiense]|uniref:4-amino-4-deoxy-L-arabinose transferase-like glycosyltransferase n=1 Tax=Kibdelosporangium banguiense TaxID=1365924 RepID=A0ABS4U254_9PSEU|nr:glycosyltransferase family 39 protein [Kibdelosporangium banguiense]MBP2330294.1 4-amino-4-deoxy-L-arabinose transferase-like glycosyltransferase [Kibdelosporangium banguiense]
MSDTALRTPETAQLPRFAWREVSIVLAVQVAVLSALSGRYGFHRDELYFIAAGKQLAWGYTDQPPITPALARLSITLFGETPVGLRVVATLAAAGTIAVIALIARELGGGRTVQWVSAALASLGPFAVAVAHMLSTTTVDMLIWALLGLAVLRLLRTGDGRWWLAVGAVIGLGLANKWLILLLVSGLATGVFAFGPRGVLRSVWLAAGVAVALVLAAPVFLWQAANDWPMLTVASGISGDDGVENRILFIPMQLVYLTPVLVPVWAAGLVRLWRDPGLRWARALAVSYPVVCVELLALGGKPYYSVPLLIMLLPAGVRPALDWLSRGRKASRRGVVTVFGVIGLAMSLVTGLPLLPPSSLNGPVLAINKEPGEQVGWPELTDSVAGVWLQIPAEQRAKSVILTSNYGQAGAIEHYGPAIGLPKPYSGHMSYADWGPPPDTMTGAVIVVGGQPTLSPSLTGCRVVTKNDNGIGLENEEQGTAITLCSGTTAPWSKIWPSLRRFY